MQPFSGLRLTLPEYAFGRNLSAEQEILSARRLLLSLNLICRSFHHSTTKHAEGTRISGQKTSDPLQYAEYAENENGKQPPATSSTPLLQKTGHIQAHSYRNTAGSSLHRVDGFLPTQRLPVHAWTLRTRVHERLNYCTYHVE